MKKVVCLIMVAVMMVSMLCACSRSFVCESCGRECEGKAHVVTNEGEKHKVCDECYQLLKLFGQAD